MEEVERAGRPALVTRDGKPVAVLLPLDEDALEDFILSTAPEFVASIDEADADLAAGQVCDIDDALADLESSPVEEGTSAPQG